MGSIRLLSYLTLLTIGTPIFAQSIEETVYSNPLLGVRLQLPTGWYISRQTGFPSLDALFLPRRGTGRVSVAVVRRPPYSRVEQVIADNNQAMIEMGITVDETRKLNAPTDQRWEVRAHQGGRIVYQVYVARGLPENDEGSIAREQFLLTLTASTAEKNKTKLGVDLRRILRSLEWVEEEPKPTPES